ncbi:MAG: rRNA maturation RNase YbeY [Candidatus Omnitrophica bacterium]|nr:rRNA maturation RNase YbeY [Candidatus Omnitrophota bacterium]
MEINIKNLQKKISIPETKIRRALSSALSKFKCPSGSLSIVFVGVRRMRTINKKYLGHDYVTDVLSFELSKGLGEIIICPRMASANADFYKTSTEKEIILYVIHGLLHLQGFDDHNPKDTIQMRSMENMLLGKQNL